MKHCDFVIQRCVASVGLNICRHGIMKQYIKEYEKTQNLDKFLGALGWGKTPPCGPVANIRYLCILSNIVVKCTKYLLGSHNAIS